MIVVRFTAFDREYAECQEEILQAIDRCGRAGDLVLRDEVERFEHAVAERHGLPWAVAVGSGYDALYLALRALELPPGDVAIPVYRHVSAVNACVNAEQGIYDVPSDDYWLSRDVVAAMPVHMEGVVHPPIPITLPIVEDACQAFGAAGLGRATLTCFSFHPMKVLGAMGDGGAVAGRDPALRDRLRSLRHHGPWGVNSRLDNIQAAILNVKLQHLDRWLAQRRMRALRYTTAFATLPLTLTLPPDTPGRVWSSYAIRTLFANALGKWLDSWGVHTMRGHDDRLLLPLYPHLTDMEQDYVISSVRAFFKGVPYE
jgi:dTDP-4-amino-4,6-dideoxygalactose transaminase